MNHISYCSLVVLQTYVYVWYVPTIKPLLGSSDTDTKSESEPGIRNGSNAQPWKPESKLKMARNIPKFPALVLV